MTATKLSDYMTSTDSTQEEVAEKIGVSRQAVSLYLLGRATPGLDVALRMRDLLGVSLDTWGRAGKRAARR